MSYAAVTTDMTCNTAVPVITKISFANNDEDSSANSSSSAIYSEDSSVDNTESSAIHNLLSISNADSNTGAMTAPAIAVMVEMYDMTYNTAVSVANKTMFATTFDTAFTSASYASPLYDIILATSFVETMTTSNELHSADNDSLTTVMMATQVCSSPTSSTSYHIDRESSGVSVAYGTTSAIFSCHSLNYFSLILLFGPSCQFDQITLLLLTHAVTSRGITLVITYISWNNTLDCSIFHFDNISC